MTRRQSPVTRGLFRCHCVRVVYAYVSVTRTSRDGKRHAMSRWTCLVVWKVWAHAWPGLTAVQPHGIGARMDVANGAHIHGWLDHGRLMDVGLCHSVQMRV